MTSPGPLDPNSAYPAVPMPEGPVPRSERELHGSTRAGLAALGIVLALGAIAWFVAIAIQLVDFLSGDCKLLGCADQTFSEHVRIYGATVIGLWGVFTAAQASHRSFRLIHAYGHATALRRGVFGALALLVIWSLLVGFH